MVCNTCGSILPDDSKFCEKCGAPVVQPVQSVQPSFTPPYQQPFDLNRPYDSYPGVKTIETTGMMVWAILLAIFGGTVFGIIAAVMLSEVKNSSTLLDAQSKYNSAKKLCIIGTCFAVLYILMIIALYVFMFAVIYETMRLYDYEYYYYGHDFANAFKMFISCI